jgi:ribosomal protein S17E
MAISRISVAVILCISVCFPSAVASTNQSTYSNQSKMAYTMHKFDNTLSPIYEVNTRIKEIPFNPSALVNFTLTKFGSGCPPEIAIYVHGYNRNNAEATEEFDRIQTSLIHNNYRIPLVGFSWNSNVLWDAAKINSKENGPKLAGYIISLHNKCPNTEIRTLAHSLGAFIIDEALVNLNNDSRWINKIASVHLLGAAISNQLIVDHADAIEHVVDKFYNLYNPEDDGLKVNQLIEGHQPLGLVGIPKGSVYSNYADTNVAYEIPPISDADGDGNMVECFEDINIVKLWGDNHCGYIGFRDATTGLVTDDGAMNIVARDWIK